MRLKSDWMNEWILLVPRNRNPSFTTGNVSARVAIICGRLHWSGSEIIRLNYIIDGWSNPSLYYGFCKSVCWYLSSLSSPVAALKNSSLSIIVFIGLWCCPPCNWNPFSSDHHLHHICTFMLWFSRQGYYQPWYRDRRSSSSSIDSIN